MFPWGPVCGPSPLSPVLSAQFLDEPLPAVQHWTSQQVGQWLQSLSLEQYVAEFAARQVDGPQLLQLDGSKLKVGLSASVMTLRGAMRSVTLILTSAASPSPHPRLIWTPLLPTTLSSNLRQGLCLIFALSLGIPHLT